MHIIHIYVANYILEFRPMYLNCYLMINHDKLSHLLSAITLDSLKVKEQ